MTGLRAAPALRGVLGLLLLATAAATVVLHLVYAGWAASGVLRGLRLPNCGCFGVFLPRPLGWSTVAEDLVVAGLAAWLWNRARTETPA